MLHIQVHLQEVYARNKGGRGCYPGFFRFRLVSCIQCWRLRGSYVGHLFSVQHEALQLFMIYAESQDSNKIHSDLKIRALTVGTRDVGWHTHTGGG